MLNLFDTANQTTPYFDRVFCISLDRQPEKWKAFRNRLPTNWPFGNVEKVSAVDGRYCQPESWWTVGKPAWGCYQSHLQIIERCLKERIESCLIFEDDAVFESSFARQAIEFLNAVPNDWELIYLGGQHLKLIEHPPVRVNAKVCIPWNVNRTHAYAIRGINGLARVRDHLLDSESWQVRHHIDHHLGQRVCRRDFPVYCPQRWLVGQDEGFSTISKNHLPTRYFQPNSWLEDFPSNFIAILGDSNTDVANLTRLLERSGLFHGSQFGRSGNGATCSKELSIAAKYQPDPNQCISAWEGSLRCALHGWIRYATYMAKENSTAAFAWLPHFIQWAPILESLLGSKLKFINVDSKENTSPARERFLRSTRTPIFHLDPTAKHELTDESEIGQLVAFCTEDTRN